ncbi:hypothetical protein ACFQZ4_40800 [Catellatospora coxensis]
MVDLGAAGDADRVAALAGAVGGGGHAEDGGGGDQGLGGGGEPARTVSWPAWASTPPVSIAIRHRPSAACRDSGRVGDAASSWVRLRQAPVRARTIRLYAPADTSTRSPSRSVRTTLAQVSVDNRLASRAAAAGEEVDAMAVAAAGRCHPDGRSSCQPKAASSSGYAPAGPGTGRGPAGPSRPGRCPRARSPPGRRAGEVREQGR